MGSIMSSTYHIYFAMFKVELNLKPKSSTFCWLSQDDKNFF